MIGGKPRAGSLLAACREFLVVHRIISFLEFIQLNLRINDLIDIGLFSVFVYYAIKYLMAKPQRPLFTFSALVTILYFLSKVFNLSLISALLKMLFTVILILIAIVFQRDIRRFIEQLSSNFSRAKKAPNLSKEFKQKMMAIIKILAEKKIGAILVLPRKSPVMNVITGGRSIYAKLDEGLVESIFDTRTPGHDGAMIIENGSITRMSCQLPLSKGAKLSLNLGTRHSAALGLSERADCLTFVVSEERGTISIAENSRLIYDVSEKFLSLKLNHYLKSKEKKEKNRRNFFDYVSQNLPLKIFSILIAVLSWTVNIYEPGISYTSFMMPVEVRNLKPEFMIKGMSHDIVKVTLSGPSSYVSQLKRKTQKILLDFSEAKDGKTIFQASDFHLNFPKNITIHGYQPNMITAWLSAYKKKKVPVLLKTKGELDPSLAISDVQIKPREKKLSIPLLMDKDSLMIPTEVVDLSKINRANSYIKIKVALPEKARLQNSESDLVEVHFNLKEKAL